MLDDLRGHLVQPTQLKRFDELLNRHHFLGSVKPVGERLHYVADDANDSWLALLLLSQRPGTTSQTPGPMDQLVHRATAPAAESAHQQQPLPAPA